MDSTVRRIIGEAEPLDPDKHAPEPKVMAAPDESPVDELANLWQTGNKGEVVRRFMEMDNETSVKLVFAIGREEAIVLARMVDQQMEANPEGEKEGGQDTTEPEQIDRPNEGSYEPMFREMFRGMDPAHLKREHND